MSDIDERRHVVDALMAKYPIFPRATIERLVNGEMDHYKTAKVHTFVPVLVHRAVSARLQDADSLPESSALDKEATIDVRGVHHKSAHATS